MAISKQTGVGLKGGDERDALTRFRKFIFFRPGERKAAKTTYNRRVRHRPIEVDDPSEGAAD